MPSYPQSLYRSQWMPGTGPRRVCSGRSVLERLECPWFVVASTIAVCGVGRYLVSGQTRPLSSTPRWTMTPLLKRPLSSPRRPARPRMLCRASAACTSERTGWAIDTAVNELAAPGQLTSISRSRHRVQTGRSSSHLTLRERHVRHPVREREYRCFRARGRRIGPGPEDSALPGDDDDEGLRLVGA